MPTPSPSRTHRCPRPSSPRRSSRRLTADRPRSSSRPSGEGSCASSARDRRSCADCCSAPRSEAARGSPSSAASDAVAYDAHHPPHHFVCRRASRWRRPRRSSGGRRRAAGSSRALVPALGSTPVRALVSRRSEIGDECGRNVAERMIETNGVKLCTEEFGDPADPPLLLIMGMSGSMLWWEERFCRMLADGGRFVIRYDHRDTGRSVTYEPGHPEYTGADLVADAVGVLDAYEIQSAHVVGVSAGGALAQLLALRFPARVLSLVLISTSPAKPAGRLLPPATGRYREFLASAVDWSDQTSVIDYLTGYARMLEGSERPV